MAKNNWNRMYKVDMYKIHDLMLDKEMNMSMLSSKIGASDSYVSSTVLGKGQVSVKYFSPLCRALGVKKEDILLDDNEPEPELPFEIPDDNVPEPAKTKEEAFDEMLMTIEAALDDFISDYVCKWGNGNV